MKIRIEQTGGYTWGASEDGKIIVDTVPFALSKSWLSSAPDADTLIICGDNPFPKSVEAFLEAHPEGRVYAPYYTQFRLQGILDGDPRILKASDKAQISAGSEKIRFSVVTQPGKAPYMTLYAGDEELYTGRPEADIEPVIYDRPTVVIPYISGCDYTETIAEIIAAGIKDSEDLDVSLIDLSTATDEETIAALVHASGILFGTPEKGGDADRRMWQLINSLPAGLFEGKKASTFGNYYHSEKGLTNIKNRLEEIGFDLIDGGFALQFGPDTDSRKGIYEYGYAFGCTLQNKPNTHRSTLVKCTVCGEIFDASLGVCPVCGVGMDKCVPVYEEEAAFTRDTDSTYLVVGGGVAAVSAAEAIRKRDKTGRIIMISKENVLPINRPMLSKGLPVVAYDPDSIRIKQPEWFDEQGIELRLSESVTAIDASAHTAVCSDGSTITYDKMIYAAGAECFVPPIPGKELDGVVTVRHIEDLLQVREMINRSKYAVVIGGGVLGLEFASELKKMRVRTTVLEMAPGIMTRQLDDETGLALQKDAENFGVKILTGVSITGILDEHGAGCASGVQISDGTVFPADIVIISCGNRGNILPAQEAGIECVRAIVVNSRMETSAADIYAAGDCAEFEGVNYQLWSEASEQGKTAGANAAGDSLKFKGIPYGTSFEGMNTEIFAIGDVGKAGKEYKMVESRNEFEQSYKKFWFDGQTLVGGVLYRDTEQLPFLTDAVVKGLSYSQIADEL